jgi:hypothetical protein
VVPLPGRCEQSAFRVQWYGAFLEFYLPQAKRTASENSPFPESWTRFIPDLAVNTPALASAFDALATVRLAQVNQDKRLLDFSSKAYGKALCAVRRAIERLNRGWNTENLATVMILGVGLDEPYTGCFLCVLSAK